MIHDLPDSIYEEFFHLKQLYAKSGVELPFDPTRKAYTNPLFFDVPYRGELVGKNVHVDGGTVEIVGLRETEVPARVGEVAAHCFGRVVVVMSGFPYYVGWIPEDQYRVIGEISAEISSERH